MSYETCVNGLVRILKTIPGLDRQNVEKADYRVLSKGHPQCLVIFPGPFSMEDSTLGLNGDFWVDWEIRLELYVRYSTEPEVANIIADFRQLIIEKIAAYPLLDGTPGVFRASIRRGDQPIPTFTEDGRGPFAWRQVLICSVREDLSSITTKE